MSEGREVLSLRRKKCPIATPAMNENDGSPVAIYAFEIKRDTISVKKGHERNRWWKAGVEHAGGSSCNATLKTGARLYFPRKIRADT
jgi:hypothetical protein